MSTAAIETHQLNQAKLASIATSLSTPTPPSASGDATTTPNPLLQRGKLKKAPAKNKKKASGSKNKDDGKSNGATYSQAGIKQTIERVKNDEYQAIQTSPPNALAPNGGDDDVLDLADQLLSQLDAKGEDRIVDGIAPPNKKSVTTAPSPAAQSIVSTTSAPAALSSTTPAGSTHSSSQPHTTTREKLHNLSDDVKHLFFPNSSAHKVHSSNSSADIASSSAADNSGKGMSRQKARKLKKEKEIEMMRRKARDEVSSANDNSIEDERRAILAGCTRMGVRIKEIDPDGHCLYSAIADQANYLRLSPHKETYASTRKYAADYMRSNPDDFLPFLESSEQDEALMTPAEYEKYCHTVESTAEWGGEPEIKALSKHFNVQIHVLQAGTSLLKIGEDLPAGPPGPMRISYHRKMYGLGEHYNSLVPATFAPPVAAAF